MVLFRQEGIRPLSNLGLELKAPSPARVRGRYRPLRRILVDAGLIDQADLVHALEAQRDLDAPLGEILVAQGLVSRSEVTKALALQHQIQQVDLDADPPKPVLARHLSAEASLHHKIVPWRRMGQTLFVATSRPDTLHTLAHEAFGNSDLDIVPVLAEPAQINRQITALYGTELTKRAAERVPPHESCRTWRVAGPRRRIWAAGAIFVASMLFALLPAVTFTAFVLWALFCSTMIMTLRLSAFLARCLWGNTPLPSDPAPPSAPTRWPKVSVLVPLLHEEEIASALIARLSQLSYPKALLQVVLVLEEGDQMTRDTIARTELPFWFDVIEVPQAGKLRTKPRALNYALEFCSGSIIGVWDAEDAPEADQINRVVQHFDMAHKNVACVQGVLDFYNARTNWISRCFTLEYATWWRVILPGVAHLGLIIPLGGTTLFFRRAALEKLRGWDAHNVTEDADLGVRLARHGYKTDLLPTVTYEEANFRAWPWIKQRSRWLKGFLITWVVHSRAPFQLIRDVGLIRFMGVQVLFLATFCQFIFAPLLWSFCLPLFGAAHPVQTTLGADVFYGLFGYFLFAEILNISVAMTAVSGPQHRHLIPWAITLPFYFILGSFAAYKALYEFVVTPFYWDKTEHGVPHRSSPIGSTASPLRPP